MNRDACVNGEQPDRNGGRDSRLMLVVAWTLVGVPLAWGIYQTLVKALVLFR